VDWQLSLPMFQERFAGMKASIVLGSARNVYAVAVVFKPKSCRIK
jgi:hypothetical protein